MIPTIGFIIGIYVILRSLDLVCSSGTRYATERVRTLMIVFSALTILVTALLLGDLLLGGLAGRQAISFDSSTPANPNIEFTPAEIRKQRQEIEELIRRRDDKGH